MLEYFISQSSRDSLKYEFKGGGKDDQLAAGLPLTIYL